MCHTENERKIRELNAELEEAYAEIEKLRAALARNLCPECEAMDEEEAWDPDDE